MAIKCLECGWPDVYPNKQECPIHEVMKSEIREVLTLNDDPRWVGLAKEVVSKPTSNWYQDVKAFHEKFGCYIAAKPSFPSPEVTRLRTDLFLEECKELSEAMKREDIVETADAFADLIYVTIGWALACGIPLDKVWAEVQKSNMLKDGGATRADGKILKPEGWVAPDIKSIIDEASK